jgi:molybdopterin biosynthesis enzyme
MTSPQRLPASLTPLDLALDALLKGVEPVAPSELPLRDALRCIAAEMPPLDAHPSRDVAAVDGYAFRARDLVGASSYSPLPLSASPIWVEAGEPVPDGCDCVLDSDSVDISGPVPQVMAEAIPGQGVRRTGDDIAAGSHVVEAGRRVLPRDLLIARAAGVAQLKVRRPRLCIVNIPGGTATADLIAESARAAGAEIVSVAAAGRDAASIAAVIGDTACDLLLSVGGSGVGRTDAALTALAMRGEVFAHGIALQPVARRPCRGKTPACCCPARPIRPLRRGGRWRFPRSIAYLAAARAGRSICRWRARLHPASASPKSCCWSESRASGSRWRQANCRSMRSRAPKPGSRCPAARKDLRRVRRSMPICCGSETNSGMSNKHLSKNPDNLVQDQFLTILSREDALARFEAALFPRAIPAEQRSLAAALGCALAEDVVAPIDVPPFDRSNVDGFAVRSADLASAGEASPVRLMLNIGDHAAPRRRGRCCRARPLRRDRRPVPRS